MDQPQSHSPIHSALSSHYHKYFHSSPKHINYNSYISDHSPKAKGKYRLRNCRQPKLKIETEAETKLSSYKDLKEIMRQKIQKESLKKQYDRYCQGVDDTDVIQKLRTELNFFNSQKIPHKNRYRPNKKSNYMSSLLDVSGKKMEKLEGKHEQFLNQTYRNEEREYEKNGSFSYEQKYRTTYLPKSLEKSQQLKSRQRISQKIEREEMYLPLTGWN